MGKISIVDTEANWNALAALPVPVVHANVTFNLVNAGNTGNKTIYSFNASVGGNSYAGHLHLVADEKKFPDVLKFHVTIATCNGLNVKTNYFGAADLGLGGIVISDAPTDRGSKQEKYSRMPNDIRPGMTLLLSNDIFFGAVS